MDVEAFMISNAQKYVDEGIADSNMDVPRKGMVFGSPDEAYEFYKLYSRQMGFAITKRTSHNFYGIKYAVTLACTKNRKPLADGEEGFARRARGLIGTGCKARIVVKDRLLRGRWTIEDVELEHNHELSPDAVRLMRCHRELPFFVKKQLEVNELAGLAQSKSIQAVFTQSGGVTQCSFTEKDMRNYVAEVRRLQLKRGDAQALMAYFREQQKRCPNFFYACDVDDDGRLRNVFWADARSRTSFKFFGDVVTFDTTYLTNRYKMPFAVFVGVNHHGQSILLGCALLSNELKETFNWCFSTFLSCMNDKAPEAIITDQCASIGNAVKEVFSGTRHRLCLWHIMKKLPEKVTGISNRDEFTSKVSAAVYDCETREQFEQEWLEILELAKEGKDFSWFQNLFEIRYMWVPVFLRDQFWAGMSTTQRSEGMNAFFDSYINSKTSLRSFVEKYDAALHSKWNKEMQEDFRCREMQPKLVTNCDFEKQFADAYTLRIFYLYQKEIKMLITCYCEHLPSQHPVFLFVVREITGHKTFRVQLNIDSCEYICECHYFEFRGIVCRHALCVFRQMGVKSFPAKYVLPRWRKDFIRNHVSQVVPLLPVIRAMHSYGSTYARAQQLLLDLVELANTSSNLPSLLLSRMHALKDELLQQYDAEKLVMAAAAPTTDDIGDSEDYIQDPILVRSKGRPRSNRLKPGREKRMKRKSKSYTEKTMRPSPDSSQMAGTSSRTMPDLNVVLSETSLGGSHTAIELLRHFDAHSV